MADRVRLATAELVTVPELMVDAGMSSMTTSQYQNRLGTARERLLGHFAYQKICYYEITDTLVRR